MLQEIDKLREIARRCANGEPLDEALSVWLGRGLDDFLSQRELSLTEAFGLRGGQGGVPWWRERGIYERNAAIRELAGRLDLTGSVNAQAKRIHFLAARYETSAWRYDRHREEMPVVYAQTARACLWRAFKSGATMPLCERQLRTILAR